MKIIYLLIGVSMIAISSCTKQPGSSPGYYIAGDVSDSITYIAMLPHDSIGWNPTGNYIATFGFTTLQSTAVNYDQWDAGEGGYKILYTGEDTLLRTQNIKNRDAFSIIYSIDSSMIGKTLFIVYSANGTDTLVYHAYKAVSDSMQINIAYSPGFGGYGNISDDSITNVFNYYLEKNILSAHNYNSHN